MTDQRARDEPLVCPECGASVPAHYACCQDVFDEILAREFGDFRYAREHRLTVDTYALQHPERYMRSARSYAAHLTGAYAALGPSDAGRTNRVVQQWLSRPTALQRPDHPPPLQRGAVTLLHVLEADNPEEHLRRVREWAASAWEAWRSFHPVAKRWIDEAFGV